MWQFSCSGGLTSIRLIVQLAPLTNILEPNYLSFALKMTDKPDLAKQFSPEGAPVEGFSHHAEDITADREPYGPPGLRGLMANPFVLMCAACSTLGGLIFGYDQGVVSVILVMDQFLEEFPRIGGSGAGFWKGLLTAMIQLGALLGAFNQGWIADRISRRYSILVAVAIFTVGSILQTAAVGYAMLTVARLIGGVGIGMLSMVAPLYISEISTYYRSSTQTGFKTNVDFDQVLPNAVVHF